MPAAAYTLGFYVGAGMPMIVMLIVDAACKHDHARACRGVLALALWLLMAGAIGVAFLPIPGVR